MPAGGFPAGWVLLRGRLIRRGGDYDARLYYDLGDGFVRDRFFAVPASGKGVINEVVCLPAGVARMKFSPMGTAGEFEFSGLSVTRLNAVERIARMAYRVAMTIYRHSGSRRRLIRLNWPRLLFDLRGAYETAGRLRTHAAAPDYASWVARFDTPDADDFRQMGKHIAHFASSPCFDVLLLAEGAAPEALRQSLDSLRGQIYRGFSCAVLGAGADAVVAKAEAIGQGMSQVARDEVAGWLAQFNAGLATRPGGNWLLLLRAGDVLAPHALYRFACEAQARPQAALLYADDDALDEHGRRCRPRFKPDWSLAHLRATNFVGDAVALRGKEVVKAGGMDMVCCRDGSYDLLLRVVDVLDRAEPAEVAHIPAVLLHKRAGGEDGSAWQQEMVALKAHLARNGVNAEVSGTLPGCRRIRYLLPDEPPLVSIIVPTRDALELIRRCLDSVLEKTVYPRFEILVMDNQSTDSDVLAYLERVAGDGRVRVLRYDQPFNYSAINNAAVRQARGEVLCLLNNDTEVISPDWLDEMVGHLLQPKVGVVGAKLYFPNDHIQHAGDLVGVAGVGHHAHVFLGRGDPGYCNRAMLAQEFSAVTAACLITWRELYQRIGGLDEEHLKVAFNDVDYCLRVRAAGHRVVWTPHAELYHYESMSRGKDQTPEKKRRARGEADYMRSRWKRQLRRDPFYNPNLSYERPDFSLSNAPIVERPWDERR